MKDRHRNNSISGGLLDLSAYDDAGEAVQDVKYIYEKELRKQKVVREELEQKTADMAAKIAELKVRMSWSGADMMWLWGVRGRMSNWSE